ncbi:MAG: polyribonucleotide nucleotidyltransferase, partial [Actinomycetota bacterium]
MVTTLTKRIGSTDLTFESGKLAKQAGGSAVVTLGETMILAACTSSKPREGIDFFPLTVDVEERMYAAGKIPGGFFRREGKASETATLTARLIDRPLRPTFADGFRDEVHVVLLVLSADLANPYDVPGINAASLATMLAGLPFDGPVGAVRVGNINGEWVVNPTYQQLEDATFDVVVAGRRNDAGTIDVLMIEGEAPDATLRLVEDGATAPTEEIVTEGLEAAKRAIGESIDAQLEFLSKVQVEKKPFEPKPLFSEDTLREVEAFAGDRMREALVPGKHEREEGLSALKEELKAHLEQQWGESYAERASEVSAAFKQLQKTLMRRRV